MDVPENDDSLANLYSLRGAEELSTLQFWKRSLHAYCLSKKKLVFTASDIVTAFTVRGLVPAYFDKSLALLIKGKNVIDSQELLSSEPVNILSSMISALWTSVFDTVKTDSRSLVCVSLLEEFELIIAGLAKGREKRDLVFTRSLSVCEEYDFRFVMKQTAMKGSFGDWVTLIQQLSENDFNLLLCYLNRKGLVAFDDKVVQVLKPTAKGKSVPDAVSEADRAFLDIRLTIRNIDSRVEKLQKKCAEYTKKALAAKSRNDSTSALMYLKLRKTSEVTIQRLSQAHYNLEDCLQTMEGTEVNQIVIAAYSSATSALRTMRKESGVTVESVENAMELFQEEMDEMQQVNDAIVSGADISEDERQALEDELASIMSNDASAANLSTDTIFSAPAPVVPTHTVVAEVQAIPEAVKQRASVAL